MRKVIGIVGEGPIDQMVLKAAINRITGESHIYRNIQPEQDMLGEFGNGTGMWQEKKKKYIAVVKARFALKRMRSLHWYADRLKKVIVLSSYLAGITLIPRRDIEYIWNVSVKLGVSIFRAIHCL